MQWFIDWLTNRIPEAKEFDPNQPRDEQGQWTDAGGNSVSHIDFQQADKINPLKNDSQRSLAENNYGAYKKARVDENYPAMSIGGFEIRKVNNINAPKNAIALGRTFDKYPKPIIFIRDGLSKNQFAIVVDHEIMHANMLDAKMGADEVYSYSGSVHLTEEQKRKFSGNK